VGATWGQRVLVYANTHNAKVKYVKHRDAIWQDVMVSALASVLQHIHTLTHTHTHTQTERETDTCTHTDRERGEHIHTQTERERD
jgi:hypothetical protein